MRSGKRMLKKDNHKIKGALIFNLPCGITCPGQTDDCAKFCYAKDAERMYPQVIPSRLRNYAVSLSKLFKLLVVGEIKKSNPKFVRIHESGDFYSQRYINDWVWIMSHCPEVTFYSYTRSYMLDFSKALKLSNFSLRYSVDPSTRYVLEGVPYAFTSKEYPKKAYACPGVDGKKCIKDCTFCTQPKGNVWFKPHGVHKKEVGQIEIRLSPFENSV
jgi:hypothetical protein